MSEPLMQCLYTLQAHEDGVDAVVVNPTGTTFVSGSFDQTIKFWNLKTGELLSIWTKTGSILCLAYSPDGQNLVSGSFNQKATLWDVNTGEALHVFESPFAPVSRSISAVAISPDGSLLAIGNRGGGGDIWNLKAGKKLVDRRLSAFTRIVFSPDNQTLVSSYVDVIVIRNLPRCVQRLWLETKQDVIASLVLSQDGATIISGHFDGNIHLWSLQTGQLMHTLTGHKKLVRSLAVSSDGQTLASGGEDRTVRLWHLPSLSQSYVAAEHTDEVDTVAFSPDGHRLVSGSSDRTIKVWQVSSLD